MFGLLKSPPVIDPLLGTLVRSGRLWNGSISLNSETTIELRLSGSRQAPDSVNIKLAHQLPSRYSELVPEIQRQLFEHYEPYKDAFNAGELPSRVEPFPLLDNSEEVWANVSPLYVLIEPLWGTPISGPTITIAYSVYWDEEHIVGARFQDWHLLELCGSVGS